MIDTAIDEILIYAKKKKKISTIPANPFGKIELVQKLFKKDKQFLDVIEFYIMLKKLDELRKERIGEFRKNVNLKIMYKGQEINVNLEQLKIYADQIEKFISSTRNFLSS